MKAKFLRFFFVLALAGVLSVSSRGQGLSPTESLDPNHTDVIPSEDKVVIVEHDSKAKTITRDSASFHGKQGIMSINSGKSKASDHKPSGKEEDDALSFNFLYYIIQKFKISDLIDE